MTKELEALVAKWRIASLKAHDAYIGSNGEYKFYYGKDDVFAKAADELEAALATPAEPVSDGA